MNRYPNIHQAVFCLLSALVIFLFSQCRPQNVAPVHYDKAVILQADTLAAAAVYEMARVLNNGTEQDSFYNGLLMLKKEHFDAKGIRENLSFYTKLRGNNINAEILIHKFTGVAFLIENNHTSAIESYEKSLVLSKEAQDSFHIFSNLKEIADCKNKMGKYEEAIEIGMQALSLAETTGSDEQLATIRLSMTHFLFKNKEYDKAIEIAQQAVPYYQSTGEKKGEAFAYSQIGVAAEFKNDYEVAASYYDKTLEIWKELQIPEALAASYGQYANFWVNRKDYAKAQKAAEEAAFWLKKTQYRGMDGQIALVLGFAMCANGAFDKGKEEMLRGLELSKESQNPYDEMYAYESLYLTYKTVKHATESLEYYEKYINLKDSLYTEKTQKNISELYIQYETVQKEKQITEMQHQHKISQLNVSLISLALLLVLGMVVAMFLRHRGRQRVLEQQNQILAKEKELTEIREQLKIQELKESKQKLTKTKKELKDTSKLLQLKNQLVEDLEMRLYNEKTTPSENTSPSSDEALRTMKILTDTQWMQFRQRYEEQFPGVQKQLKTDFPTITSAEVRLFLLTKLQFDTNEIADTLGISKKSVWRSRNRLGKKLELVSTVALDRYIEKY